jgi:cell fate regulator YaaT (PSP1 superfamily)
METIPTQKKGCGCGSKGGGCCYTSHQKLNTYDWLCDLPETHKETDYVEVQFKNTRKGFFLNATQLPLDKGDIVAVEASPGHDIGEVTLTGRLVLLQMNKNRINPEKYEIRKIYRKAREVDLEKFNEAKAREQETMIKARQIAESLQLNMKIGDVEFQGDGNKAIFYYIADERVDFRQLIKVFAETFRVRIEMKQIGARQEAGRIGGIGPCGRELCCSGWMTNFNSVSTASARYQDISMNPQKLAGQCGKLKCCMNYELDTYVDALKDFPSKEIPLETLDGTYYHFKTDTFKGAMTYSSAPNFAANLVTIDSERAREVIRMNKKGQKPGSLDESDKTAEKKIDYDNVVGEDSLTRFDTQKKRSGKGNRGQHKANQPLQRPSRPKKRPDQQPPANE